MEFLRRRLGLILRTLVSLALIGWLVRKINWANVWRNILTMDPVWLAAGFAAFLPVLLIVSWRWRLLLRAQEVRLPFWRVFELNMIGQYFSAFLIGTTGGDFVKIFYVARAVPQRKAAVALTVMADRVIGLVALLLFGAALALPNLRLLLSTDTTRAATGMFFFFAAGGVAVAVGGTLAPLLLGRPAIRKLLGKLPQAERVSTLVAAYERLARAWKVNLVALVVSLPSHVCSTLLGYCVLRAMHLQPEPPLLVFCAIIVIVNMLISLPVSISGVGLREQLFVFFFALVGIDGDRAVTFSITCFFLSILWSLAGGPFYFLYRHETHTPAPGPQDVGPLLSETR